MSDIYVIEEDQDAELYDFDRNSEYDEDDFTQY